MTTQYFAQLDDSNTVTRVAVVSAEFMAQNPDRYDGRWVETFFDVAGRTYAGVGYTYDQITDDFTAPVIVIPTTEE